MDELLAKLQEINSVEAEIIATWNKLPEFKGEFAGKARRLWRANHVVPLEQRKIELRRGLIDAIESSEYGDLFTFYRDETGYNDW